MISSLSNSLTIFYNMILFTEEDSDEIKIGTACKNAGCSKVSHSVPLLNPTAKLLNVQFCFPFLGVLLCATN